MRRTVEQTKSGLARRRMLTTAEKTISVRAVME